MSSERQVESAEAIREMVREGYTRVAERTGGCCGEAQRQAEERAGGCCGGTSGYAGEIGRKIGYSEADLASVPDGANLGVGCGNPTAIDALREGEVVVDLGSGAGMDVFLAARQVGPRGRVIGIDMTDAMLTKAQENARKGGYSNVEFRKGTIEELPLEDESVDVIISNCVINLSPEKDRVYREVYRVLRPGGRVMVSDIVLERPLPQEIRESVEAYVGCIGGASLRSTYLKTIEEAGFREIRVEGEARFGETLSPDDPQVRDAMSRFGITIEQLKDFMEGVTSLHLFAVK